MSPLFKKTLYVLLAVSAVVLAVILVTYLLEWGEALKPPPAKGELPPSPVGEFPPSPEM